MRGGSCGGVLLLSPVPDWKTIKDCQGPAHSQQYLAQLSQISTLCVDLAVLPNSVSESSCSVYVAAITRDRL